MPAWSALLFPVALAATWTVPEPVIPELNRLMSRDQRISLQLHHVTAAKALTAIAEAGALGTSMAGPSDCCSVDLNLTDVPLRRALELLAAQTDARYEVLSTDILRVWLPEELDPRSPGEITKPGLVKNVEPDYPDDARRARVAGYVILRVVVRWDGTIGRVEVVRGVKDWPSLDAAAVASARKRIYKPATKYGEPVSVVIPMRVDFRLS